MSSSIALTAKINEEYEKIYKEGLKEDGKSLVEFIKKNFEKKLDDIIDKSGMLIEKKYGKDSKEIKDFSKASSEIFDNIYLIKQMLIHL